MFKTRILPLLSIFLCMGLCVLPATAAEVDCTDVYCLSAEDFSQGQVLKGICITSLPEERTGSLLLGARILRPGDILTAQQIAMTTFSPLRTETDRTAEVGYLPICENSVAPSAVMTISIRGKEDKAPVAEDLATETYKNLPTTMGLKVKDPEGQPMTFTVTRQPRRGTITIAEDGSFTYTPKKNKVGVDSFTFTATDPAGKVSREATVTITILKPTDAAQYTDTAGQECRFAAEWMRHTGIFVGENLAGNPCFNPEKAVTRGEFTSMLVKALDIPEEEELILTGYEEEIPLWLQPYLAAAVRSGLTAGLPERNTFGYNDPISGSETAVMLQNALDLSFTGFETAEDGTMPAWAAESLTALSDHGIVLEPDSILTRADAAQILYKTVQLINDSVFVE